MGAPLPPGAVPALTRELPDGPARRARRSRREDGGRRPPPPPQTSTPPCRPLKLSAASARTRQARAAPPTAPRSASPAAGRGWRRQRPRHGGTAGGAAHMPGL